MKPAEVRQRRGIGGQSANLVLEPGALGEADLGQPLVEIAGDADQDLHQEGHRTAGGADIGHEQHGVAGGLVDLHAVPVHQLIAFELVTVVTGTADRQGDPGRVKDELVGLPGPHHRAQPGAQRLGDMAGPELVGDDVGGAKTGHVLAQQRMVVDRVAQLHGVLDLTGHQLHTLQRHLAATQIQRGQNLVVRRGRGVRHIGLVECLGDFLFEVLVEDVDHRTLPQRRERLMGGLGGVDAHPRLGRVGAQAALEQFGVGRRIRDVASQLFFVGRDVVGVGQRVPELARGVHCGAGAQDRVETGEGEPGLVPEEHQVRFDRQALLHDAFDVVDDPVEGAVGQGDHLDPVQLPGAPQIQQLGFDLADRHRPVHGVVVERVGLQIHHVGSA